jgi:hypothetical protein
VAERTFASMDPQRQRELADPSNAAFEDAMRQTWEMVDPFNPPPPGSYARGSHEGICAALKTMRENYDRERLKRASAAPSQDSLQLREGDATGNSGAACATEQECDGMPWCRIEGKCRKAQTTTTAAPPTPGDQQ